MSSALRAFFAPRAVAVLGVSRNPAKLGYRLLENLTEGGFAGPVYPVHPAGEPILGRPTVKSVEALPPDVDLALVTLPAPAVRDALVALGVRGVRAAVVLSSGFGEVDEPGRESERELAALARATGMRLVGPNCMGVYSAPVRLNGTFFWDLPRLPGGLAVVSQSGAYGGLLIRHLGTRGLGTARFLSLGNQVDVELGEVVEFLAEDPATTLIACFVEALRDGRRFVEAATQAGAHKPVVVLKAGRSEAGRRAAGSHTGALAGAWELYRAACRRAGAVLTEETEEFLDAIETLALAGARRAAAPRVAVITVSGGPSVMAADAAERAGLVVPPLGGPARQALRTLLPSFAAVGNPVDLTPQVEPHRVPAAVRTVLDQPDVAGAVVVDVGLDLPALGDAVAAAVEATDKPAVAFVADAPALTARLRSGGIPVLPSPERAVRAWRALWLARPRRTPGPVARPSLPEDVARALAAASGPLPFTLARSLLAAYGVPFVPDAVVDSPEEAVAAAERLGFPVVVKADLPHKSEAGAVRLGLCDPAAVRAAAVELRARTGARLVVQVQAPPGMELLVGGRRDEVFGPVVAVGTGGILTEVVRDVSFALAPLDPTEAVEVLHEGLRPRLLAGVRGLPPCHGAALVATMLAVGDLLVCEGRVREVDLNPVIAAGARALAVDALVVVG